MVMVVATGVNELSDRELCGDFDTVGQLKSSLATRWNIQVTTLLLVQSGTLLQDNEAEIQEDGEHYYCTVHVFHKLSTIFTVIVVISDDINLEVENIEIDIPGDSSVSTLKARIDKELGISPHRQVLTTLNVLMVDNLDINEYATSSNPRIYLSRNPEEPSEELMITVTVTDAVFGQSKQFRLSKSDTIHMLRGMVLRARLVIDPPFHLEFDDFQLLLGSKSLAYYGIKDGDTITLRYD